MSPTVTASVVFTDLVGSTELGVRLGPAEADRLRATYFGLLREAIEATRGTEVKNLGDGLMVVYQALGDALDGAVAMQQQIDRHNRRGGEPLHLRVGLSSGDAVEDDADYFGEPVVEAARLCALAEPGQILTTALVRQLARRREHTFTDRGVVELKGLPDPVDACAVGWVPAAPSAQVPMPSRLGHAPSTGVVGRAVEQERLRAALREVAGGKGRRVELIAGEPGMGKTTLCADLAQHAHAERVIVLYGRCDDEIGVPYQPFVEALGGYVADAPEPALRAVDPLRLGDLSRLVPQIRTRLPDLDEPRSTDPDAERYLLFNAVTALLRSLAGEAPVLVVLDDLHWADKPTVQLLQHVVGTLDGAAVLVVGTYRASDLSPSHPLTGSLAALRREVAVDRLALDGLGDAGVVALLEGLAGHELDEGGKELALAVHRETGGNPFFAGEMLRHLAETGTIARAGQRWSVTDELAPLALPESVREVVGQRVRWLGEDAHHVLSMAAVVGRDFDLRLAAHLADVDEDEALGVLERAAAANVVAEVDGTPGRFTFRHALFQHTLYDALSSSRRARTHRRIGEFLEVECGDDPGDRIGELAHHFLAATTPTDVERAATYAGRAGQRALAALAPDEAIRWFRQALTLLEGLPEHDHHARLDLLIGLGDAQRQTGDGAFRETLLDAAAEAVRLGDTDRLVAAVLSNQRGTASAAGVVDTERVEAIERALEAAGAERTGARARLLATLASELIFGGDFERVRRLAEEAESIARDLDDESVLLRVLNLTLMPLSVPQCLDRNDEASLEALAIAARVADPVARFWAAQIRLQVAVTRMDRPGIDEASEQTEELGAEIGQPYLTSLVLVQRAWKALMLGDATAAERFAEQALAVGAESGQADAFIGYATMLASIRAHQGRVEELLPLVGQVAADSAGMRSFDAARAALLCEAQRFDEARPLLASARARDFDRGAYEFTWLTTNVLWAEAAAWLGDAEAAATLHERLAPFADQGVVTGVSFLGPVGMYVARLATVLGRHDEAASRCERAATQLAALPAPFWQARNQLEWARALLARGQPGDGPAAARLLDEAQATAATFGCTTIAARAAELARSHR